MTTIFITIPWFHPAYKAGGPVQSIANLVAQYHPSEVQFKIYCGNCDLDGSVLNDVVFDEWTSYNANTQVWYASKCSIKRAFHQIQPDILFINGIYSWYFTIIPLIFCKARSKIISVRGMLHPGALSQKSFKKKCWLFCWKLLGLHHRCQFHATSKEEAEFIQDTFGSNTIIFVAPNFPRVFSLHAGPEKITGYLNMLSIGIVSPMKNYLLVLQALQHCTAKIIYNIYGPVKDSAYWESCQQQIQLLPSNITVVYQGDIAPQKVAGTLAGHQLFILPSKSENFGHAIYEALSTGRPVITSHHTPWNKLAEAKAGKNVEMEIDSIKAAISFFAKLNEQEYRQWSIAAIKYAANSIDTDSIKLQYSKMFNLSDNYKL